MSKYNTSSFSFLLYLTRRCVQNYDISLFDENPQVIHNKEVMNNRAEKYQDDPDFQEFLNREFDKTAVHATIDELAEFAFGGFDEAVQAFEEQKEQNES